VKKLSEKSCRFASFQKKCLNNDAFRAYFVVNPEETIQSRPPVGLGIRLSDEAITELHQLIQDYLGAADMIIVEDPEKYKALKEEVREKCPDVPMGSI
jgi:hypothetical protein